MVHLGGEANPILRNGNLIEVRRGDSPVGGQTIFRSWDDDRASCSVEDVRIPSQRRLEQQHDQQEAGHRKCDACVSGEDDSLTSFAARDPPDYRQDRGNEDRGELTRKRQTTYYGRGPEPDGVVRLEEPPEEPEHGRRAGDQRKFHRYQRTMGKEIGAQCKEPGCEAPSPGDRNSAGSRSVVSKGQEPDPGGAEAGQG